MVCRHPLSRRRSRRRCRLGLEQLGAPLERGADEPVDQGPSTASWSVFGSSRASCSGYARPLLSAHGRRALRGPEAPHLFDHAARHPHRHRAGGDPVRHHDRHRIGRRRRCGRLPAGAAGPDARLEADQGGGVPDRQDHGDGLLAVRRLGAVLGRFRASSAVRRCSRAGCCR